MYRRLTVRTQTERKCYFLKHQLALCMIWRRDLNFVAFGFTWHWSLFFDQTFLFCLNPEMKLVFCVRVLACAWWRVLDVWNIWCIANCGGKRSNGSSSIKLSATFVALKFHTSSVTVFDFNGISAGCWLKVYVVTHICDGGHSFFHSHWPHRHRSWLHFVAEIRSAAQIFCFFDKNIWRRLVPTTAWQSGQSKIIDQQSNTGSSVSLLTTPTTRTCGQKCRGRKWRP